MEARGGLEGGKEEKMEARRGLGGFKMECPREVCIACVSKVFQIRLSGTWIYPDPTGQLL